MADWLTAYDDLFTARHAHCLLCGHLNLGDAWHGIVEVGGLSVAYTLCLSCKRHDANRVQVRTLLARRSREELRV